MASKKGRPERDLGDMLLKAMIKTHKMNYEGEESRIRAKGWKIYIAGKVTGCPESVFTFGKAAALLEREKMIPLNPRELREGLAPADYMRICLAMIDTADAVVMLPGWENSPGARLERDYCTYTGKCVVDLPEEMIEE